MAIEADDSDLLSRALIPSEDQGMEYFLHGTEPITGSTVAVDYQEENDPEAPDNEKDCPLPEGASIRDLPLRFQRLLLDPSPARAPKRSTFGFWSVCCFLFLPGSLALVFLLAWMIFDAESKQLLGKRHTLVLWILLLVGFVLALFAGGCFLLLPGSFGLVYLVARAISDTGNERWLLDERELLVLWILLLVGFGLGVVARGVCCRQRSRGNDKPGVVSLDTDDQA